MYFLNSFDGDLKGGELGMYALDFSNIVGRASLHVSTKIRKQSRQEVGSVIKSYSPPLSS